MKTLQYAIITSLFVSTGLIADTVPNSKASELSWVDEQVAAIKPARVGAKRSYLVSTRDPFIFLKKEGKATKTSGRYYPTVRKGSNVSTSSSTEVRSETKGILTLEAVINKSALIDGKWYKEGQNVYSYKLERVEAKTVILTSGQKKIVLSTKTKHKSLKFNNN